MADKLSLSNNQNSVRMSASGDSFRSPPIIGSGKSEPDSFLRNPLKKMNKRAVSSIKRTHEAILENNRAKFEKRVFFEIPGKKTAIRKYELDSDENSSRNKKSSNNLSSVSSLQRADAQYFDPSSNSRSESVSNSLSDISGDSWIKRDEYEQLRSPILSPETPAF